MENLRAAFTDARTAPWAEALPHADSPAVRVQRTVAFLCDKRDVEGTNGLVLLLRVLANRATDACRGDLAALAATLEQVPPEALATLTESEYAEFVTQDLPQMLTFLALFAVGHGLAVSRTS